MSQTVASFEQAASQASTDSRAGFGVLETERGNLPLVALDVKAKISDLMAETTVRQTFRNALDEPLEATYIFPLPDRAAVTRFQMHVAGRTIDGVLQERGAAREEYDRAIQQGHRAAIAEEDRSGVFSLRVGNILPQEVATVELTLVEPLAVSDGEATFRFPLVVAPRYTPGIPLDGPSVGAGVTPDTDEVPDASRVTPPVLLPGFPNPVRLTLEVQLDPVDAAIEGQDANVRTGSKDLSGRAGAPQVRCSLHSTITDEGPPWTVKLQPGERLNRDFILRFPVAATSMATSLKVSPATDGKPGVFALTLLPPALREGKPRPRQIVFVLDRSGSMSGWKMVAARRALGRMIDTLLDHDRFTVLAFDDTVEHPPHIKDGLVPGTNRERWQMLEWLGRIDSRGGTEMRPALDAALRLFTTAANGQTGELDAAQQRILVIVTDGQVTGEDAILRRFAKESASISPRIFTVGIDRAVNAGFLRRLADIGFGNCELVESEDRLDKAMDRIHRLIGTPVLTEVRLEPLNFDLVAESVSPARLPDVFVDRPVTVPGRHLSTDGSIRLRLHGVDAAGKPWQQEVVGRPGPAQMLNSTWGRAKVRDLEDEYASGCGRDPKKLAQQIVDVSLESHVLSRFTAYVAVDRSEVVNKGSQQQIVQPVEIPEGWTMAAGAPAAYIGGVAPCLSALISASVRSAKDPGIVAAFDAEDSRLCVFTDAAIDFSDDDSDTSVTQASDRVAIVRFVEVLIADAVQLRANEVHIEPLADRIRVRFLINGKFVERESLPLGLLDAIVDHLKGQAKLDPHERDAPQNGHIVAGSGIVLDVCISPSHHGASIVLKIPLDQLAKKGGRQGIIAALRKRFWEQG